MHGTNGNKTVDEVDVVDQVDEERSVREWPMIFSAPMVRALLSGKKTQTRRVISKRNSTVSGCSNYRFWDELDFEHHDVMVDDCFCENGAKYLHVPRFYAHSNRNERWPERHWVRSRIEVGDRIWVKETFQSHPEAGATYDGVTIPSDAIVYAADMSEKERKESGPWTSPIFMPRWASRGLFEVAAVRPERVQAISETDALAEGIDVNMLRGLLAPLAAKTKTKPLHWIHGDDEALSFCFECCAKRVETLRKEGKEVCVDGGWPIEEDGPQYCEDCGVVLECSLLDCGVEDELKHFAEYGATGEEYAFHEALYYLPEDLPLRIGATVEQIGYRWLWDFINGKKYPWSENRWVWAYTFAAVTK